MSHKRTTPKNLARNNAPMISEGLEISLKVNDPKFTEKAESLKRAVAKSGILGLEVRVPSREQSSRENRDPKIKLLAGRMVQHACRGGLWTTSVPTQGVIDHILLNVPVLSRNTAVNFDRVLAPVDRQSGERFIMLAPNRDDAEMLSDIRYDILSAFRDATGVSILSSSRPIDMTVGYAHGRVDLADSEKLARAWQGSMPLNITFGPEAEFRPDPRQRQ